ncbi:hypothetical protein MGYG_01458 [Nannizzia gypsea CBS 118893]|uniref:Uncharacterized protein n=1 Tax=Arthroderma gypseum (strain ATCC MYA-4604 / CBS 118893) TaxID=535722 RepID=E5R0Y7_ARTGP|nr:hypothetical protein MGYG_01458 [Nannizzia gypsea CBS 118893]EFQ98429.1 hypothetical protein MGYG_01458 [Nannizzia gypsea CBS 118893]
MYVNLVSMKRVSHRPLTAEQFETLCDLHNYPSPRPGDEGRRKNRRRSLRMYGRRLTGRSGRLHEEEERVLVNSTASEVFQGAQGTFHPSVVLQRMIIDVAVRSDGRGEMGTTMGLRCTLAPDLYREGTRLIDGFPRQPAKPVLARGADAEGKRPVIAIKKRRLRICAVFAFHPAVGATTRRSSPCGRCCWAPLGPRTLGTKYSYTASVCHLRSLSS